MPIGFVTADAFVPEAAPWVPVGAIGAVEVQGAEFRLSLRDPPLVIRLGVLSETCVRVRFHPRPEADGAADVSHAIIDRLAAPLDVQVLENSAERLIVAAGALRLEVDLGAFALRIFRGGRLVCADRPGRGILWRPGEHGIACIKARPAGAVHCGFGEKGGATLLKTGSRLTNFNFDNFMYARAPIPPGGEAGPLNVEEPLYASIPLLIEINRAPEGEHAGPAYCYGLFLDNVSQSYFDLSGGAEAETGDGRTVFGALFGALDYTVLLGDGVPDILAAFTRMTGRSGMPPAWAFGFHQGCYGYFDRARLEAVAQAYRDARIPIDGLHIDIDLQDNYRVFTHSEAKFPDAPGMLAGLRAAGFKCSTIVTPLVTTNPLDETGAMVPFAQRQALLEAGCLLYDVRAGRPLDTGPPDPEIGLFSAAVSYGANRGFNPYPYPPLAPNRDGVTPLGAEMNYPDLGRAEVREVWSRQYAHLLQDLGLDMIWQDMMCPAAAVSAATPEGTLPLDLMTHDGQGWVPHGVCHNTYSTFLLQATDAALRTLRPDTRPFILSRGGYAGLQRYAALWTGDNASSWDFLRITVPQVLGIGLSGIPISGADVGGFAPGPVPQGTTTASVMRDGRVVGGVTDPELFVRWMQAGAFLPWFRNHYLGYDKEYQEVYAFGEPVAAICRRWIELRYRMLPVWYDAMYEWTQTGMPIARALFLNDPEDGEVYRHLDDQFFVGRDILVAPILFPATQAGATATREVYLPAGSAWFPLAPEGPPLLAPLGPAIEGGRSVRIEVALDEMPVFVRAGAVLPLRSRVEQFVGELAANPLEIVVYPGPDATRPLYQDDGVSMKAEREAGYRTTRIESTAVRGGRRVRVRRLHDGWTPAETYLLVRFPGVPKPARVTVANCEAPAVPTVAALDDVPCDAWAWDEASASAVVKVFDRAAEIEITVHAATPPARPATRRTAR